jgi:hypothetical protein
VGKLYLLPPIWAIEQVTDICFGTQLKMERVSNAINKGYLSELKKLFCLS